ncbi:MAG: hypothetical protein L6V93_09745 [Clostridiales bacterium]|nr:MAG: hypothetical protein L6V93_09745 [Clostridiales bacterium]
MFIFGMTIAAALYFADRMSFMLSQHNVAVSATITGDLIHLQVQFMMALFFTQCHKRCYPDFGVSVHGIQKFFSANLTR